MGGCKSLAGISPNETIATHRRRLSIGTVGDEKKTVNGSGEEDDDRGLIANLDSKNIIEILNKFQIEGDRKGSISSLTDSGKTSFSDKKIGKMGDEIDPANLGFTCRKGLKPESPNQDSWFVLQVDGNFSMYAVFDGHGQKGHDVSNFVKDNLPKIIIQHPEFKSDDMSNVLKKSFLKTQSLIATADRMQTLSAAMSGTTATLVVHDHTNKKLYVAHVADSTAVLGKKQGSGKDKSSVTAQALTVDHKPNLKEERQRIEKSGGRVVFDGYANHRVYANNARYPGLNMSRCLGDIMAQQDCGLIAEPEVSVIDISPDDKVLLLCSDGVWEFITHKEAVELVSKFPPAKAKIAAERLAKEAWDRWMHEEGGSVVDDITVILVYLNTDTELLS